MRFYFGPFLFRFGCLYVCVCVKWFGFVLPLLLEESKARNIFSLNFPFSVVVVVVVIVSVPFS